MMNNVECCAEQLISEEKRLTIITGRLPVRLIPVVQMAARIIDHQRRCSVSLCARARLELCALGNRRACMMTGILIGKNK